MTDEPTDPPPPRMALAPPEANAITLLDYFAAAVLVAGLGASSYDIFEKAAAMVAESHRRKRTTP